jgi:hypothetical protein
VEQRDLGFGVLMASAVAAGRAEWLHYRATDAVRRAAETRAAADALCVHARRLREAVHRQRGADPSQCTTPRQRNEPEVRVPVPERQQVRSR